MTLRTTRAGRSQPLEFCLALWAATLLVACRPDDPGAGRQYRSGERVIHDVRWDTLYSITSAIDDTLLLQARLIAARAGELYVYDFGDSRLKAFDRQGKLRWAFGRSGEGPREFRSPTALGIAGDGNVWVTDAGAARFTVVDRDGGFQQHISFEGHPIHRALPIRNRQLLVLPSIDEHLWEVLDEQGRVTDSAMPPIAALRDAHPNARAGFVGVSPDGTAWGIAFILASPFLIYENARLRCIGNLIEGTAAFPAVDSYRPGLPIWAVGLALGDSSAFVLARGQTEYEREIVDEYSTRDCSYIRTLRLPRKLQAIVYDGETFYFYHEKPIPTILAMRPVF